MQDFKEHCELEKTHGGHSATSGKGISRPCLGPLFCTMFLLLYNNIMLLQKVNMYHMVVRWTRGSRENGGKRNGAE